LREVAGVTEVRELQITRDEELQNKALQAFPVLAIVPCPVAESLGYVELIRHSK